MNNTAKTSIFIVGIIVFAVFMAGCLSKTISDMQPDGNNSTSSPSSANIKTACNVELDCACGTDIETGSCFVGNKKYVNTEKQCPDFCTGIAGNIKTKCIDKVCKQV